MGRVYEEFEVDGRRLWTIFDTGARNSYVARSATPGLPSRRIPPQGRTIGGGVHQVDEQCWVGGLVEGNYLDTRPFVLDDLGIDENGRPIDLLFGAVDMQYWGIRPDPNTERVDFSGYHGDWVEY